MQLLIRALLTSSVIILSAPTPLPAAGQTSTTSTPAMAISIPALENQVDDNTVICTYGESYIPCNSPYAANIFGVVTANPLIQIENSTIENPIYVVQDGVVDVRVSTTNGTISTGDALTSSNLPGVAQKATDPGPVLGFARADYAETDGTQIGTIPVNLSFNGTSNNFVGQAQASLDSVPKFWRALIAGIVVVVTFIFSFIQFKRASQSGLEAIGRNPLAKNSIQISLLTNYLVTGVFAFLGLVAAYFIVSL